MARFRAHARKYPYAPRVNVALSDLSRVREYGSNPIPLKVIESRMEVHASSLGPLGPRCKFAIQRHLRLLHRLGYIVYTSGPEPTVTVRQKFRKLSRAVRQKVHAFPCPTDETDEQRLLRENRCIADELDCGHKKRLPKFGELWDINERHARELKECQRALGRDVNPSLLSIPDDEDDRASEVGTDYMGDEEFPVAQPPAHAQPRSPSPALTIRGPSPALAPQTVRKPTHAEAAYATPVSAPRRQPTDLGASPSSPSLRESRAKLDSPAQGTAHGSSFNLPSPPRTTVRGSHANLGSPSRRSAAGSSDLGSRQASRTSVGPAGPSGAMVSTHVGRAGSLVPTETDEDDPMELEYTSVPGPTRPVYVDRSIGCAEDFVMHGTGEASAQASGSLEKKYAELEQNNRDLRDEIAKRTAESEELRAACENLKLLLSQQSNAADTTSQDKVNELLYQDQQLQTIETRIGDALTTQDYRVETAEQQGYLRGCLEEVRKDRDRLNDEVKRLTKEVRDLIAANARAVAQQNVYRGFLSHIADTAVGAIGQMAAIALQACAP